MSKTLTELSEDYFTAAKNLEMMIERNRRELKEVTRKKNYLKIMDLRRKLKVLYDQHRDVLETAEKLKHYYDEEPEVKSA